MAPNELHAHVNPDEVIRKCARRIVPLALFGFFLCYLDRSNVGMASLTMNADLGITPAMYGWGVGLFFWGYCLFEVPSNIALARFGARVWIARIMVMWGAASLAMAWVWSPESYYVLRFLLGVAEAGFVPGIIYYFRLWFPERYNNRMIGLFLLANPLSALIGNPLSGLLLQLDGVLDMKGWQWLFIIESVPTILFGLVIFMLLPSSPGGVKWLATAEKEWLENELERERMARQGIKSESVAGVLFSGRIWVLSSIYLGIVVGIYGVGFFLPQIVKEFGLSTASVGFVSAIPSAFGAVAMVLWSRHSDKTGERAGHTAIGCAMTMVGLTLAAYAPTPTISMVGLTLTSMGTLAGMVTFWSMPNALISGGQAAAAFGLINTIGSFGGVVGPNIMGFLRDSTGDFRSGLLGLAACQIVGIAVALYFRKAVNAARAAQARTSTFSMPQEGFGTRGGE
ncbi:putative tartrate transporter [Cupriavidus taiwanensis]|uniref:Tartrate transporter n=1 Tax=Cupriavidus taiwanensis TaxID=164546 RepID=A0A375CQU2_9BURK|nr:MFS transporter [Cupriavidus taiwanensis]SOY77528.1 putative tartrate transporter [Cupriavidus taiwanensis]